MDASPILVCFAVKEEAAFFHPPGVDCEKLITGMGANNAAKSFRAYLAVKRPRLVITAGYAGGLNPQLVVGAVVFDEDGEAQLGEKLIAGGALKGTFHCAPKVAVTAAEKWALWQSTGADAVEMESDVIRKICREHAIRGATVRVISDSAGEDLPLDFNSLMTPDDRIDYFKLARKILCAPQKIPQLMRFQKETKFAARRLSEALQASLSTGR